MRCRTPRCAALHLPAASSDHWGGSADLPCRTVDPEVFFGLADSQAGEPLCAWERDAIAVCTACPIRAACLREALRYPGYDQHGVVGGMTAQQRRALLLAGRSQRTAA